MSTYHECWTVGDNQYGQQMNGTTKRVHRLTKIQRLDKKLKIRSITSGNKGSVYILSADNRLIVCGQNEVGELGILDTIIELIIVHRFVKSIKMTQIIPKDIIAAIRGFSMKHIPNSLAVISSPITMRQFKVKYVSNGIASNHKFIITDKGGLYGFGSNLFRQISLQRGFEGAAESAKLFSFKKMKYFKENKIRIKQIDGTVHHSIFLSDDGNVYRCGTRTRFYQNYRSFSSASSSSKHIERVEGIDSRVVGVSCGYDHTVCFDENSKLIVFGANAFGQCCVRSRSPYYGFQAEHVRDPLYIDFDGGSIQKIVCGARHTLILTVKGSVYGSGDNTLCQIGDGTKSNAFKPVLNETLKHETVTDVKCGFYHNVAQTDSNEYWLWGDNEDRQCLVFSDEDDDEDDEHELVKIPTKYECADKEIVAIYPGFYSTRIVCKHSE